MNWIVHSLVKNWFLCGIVLGILLAWADPEIGMKGGPLHPEITIKYFGLFKKMTNIIVFIFDTIILSVDSDTIFQL